MVSSVGLHERRREAPITGQVLVRMNLSRCIRHAARRRPGRRPMLAPPSWKL